MLLINPHLPWGLPFMRFTEARLAGPESTVYGATLVGMPVMILGFNEHLGWSHTVNTVDALDAYRLRLAPRQRPARAALAPGDAPPLVEPGLRGGPPGAAGDTGTAVGSLGPPQASGRKTSASSISPAVSPPTRTGNRSVNRRQRGSSPRKSQASTTSASGSTIQYS